MEWHTFSGEVRTNNSQKKRENMTKDSGEASCPVLLGARCLPENHQSTKEMDTLSFQFQLHGDTAEKLGPVTDRNGVKRHRCKRQAFS